MHKSFSFGSVVKRALCTVLSAGIITACAVTGYADDSRLTGDVDNDGSVNINDVTAIQQHIAELGSPDREGLLAGDVNGNGKTNIDDATEI